jgi:hypothetical protein
VFFLRNSLYLITFNSDEDPKSKSSKNNLTEVLDQILLKIRFVNDRVLYAYGVKSLANTKQLEEVSM